MSYKYITQYDSPNFSQGNNGRNLIIIHHWGDPATNPTFQGVVNTLINPARKASAHFVATGTDRQVACLVELENSAWHAGTQTGYNPNFDSIGIECDPRCRDEDYDVVAELICEIRAVYGDLPIKGHNQFVATQCPGNWDLNRLDALSRKKQYNGEFGKTTNIKGEDIMDKETVNYAYLLATGEGANKVRTDYWTGKPSSELLKALYNVDNVETRNKLASIPALEKTVADNTAKIKDLQAQINDLTALLATESKARQKAEQDTIIANDALKQAEKALQSKDAEIVELKKQAEIDNQSDIEEALKNIKKQEELTAELRAQEIINKALEEKQKADNLACIKSEQSVSIVSKFIQSIIKLLTKKGK